MNERFPDFLIIGGMKCGSTTLYRDLATHPRVFFPIDKEPDNLIDDAVLSGVGRGEYAEMFASASSDQLCAEASTSYTKRPKADGTATRAKAICGGDLRVIYVVREPIARVSSHHHHEHIEGLLPADLEDAVRDHPSLVDYTRYAYQVEPWIAAFGADHVRVIRFEDFTSARAETTGSLQAWLGLDPRPHLVQADQVFNKSEGKPVMTGGWQRVRNNPVYDKLVRPLLSQGIKDRLRGTLLPKAKSERQPPRPETAERILDAVAEDHEQLREIMGLDGPVWDRDESLAKARKKFDAWQSAAAVAHR
ncbi:MAG: sulfotransferase domain-containing protein [Planctomycetota bacterium]